MCQNAANSLDCAQVFHLHCKRTQEKNEVIPLCRKKTIEREICLLQYACKCSDDQDRCIAMTEECDDFDHCEKVCRNALYEGTSRIVRSLHSSKEMHAFLLVNSKTNQVFPPSSMMWIILLVGILVLLAIVILLMTVRYRRGRKKSRQPPGTSRM